MSACDRSAPERWRKSVDIWSVERRGRAAESREGDLRIAHQHDYDRLLFSPLSGG